MLSDEQLAKIGYEAMVRSWFAHPEMKPQLTWEHLTAPGKTELTVFASAVRGALQDEAEDDETASRFREAVGIAFHQMRIRDTRDTAAWYTLRDWLKENPVP